MTSSPEEESLRKGLKEKILIQSGDTVDDSTEQERPNWGRGV